MKRDMINESSRYMSEDSVDRLQESATYVSTDNNGNLLPGWKLNTINVPVYFGQDIGVRGIGTYGQSVPALINTGFVKSATLSLITTP